MSCLILLNKKFLPKSQIKFLRTFLLQHFIHSIYLIPTDIFILLIPIINQIFKTL